MYLEHRPYVKEALRFTQLTPAKHYPHLQYAVFEMFYLGLYVRYSFVEADFETKGNRIAHGELLHCKMYVE